MGDTPWGAAGARERRQGWLALLIPTPPARHRGRRPAPRSMVKFTGRASAGVVGSASPPPGGRSRSTSGGSPPGSTPACRPPGSGTELPGFVRSCAVSGSQRSGAGGGKNPVPMRRAGTLVGALRGCSSRVEQLELLNHGGQSLAARRPARRRSDGHRPAGPPPPVARHGANRRLGRPRESHAPGAIVFCGHGDGSGR